MRMVHRVRPHWYNRLMRLALALLNAVAVLLALLTGPATHLDNERGPANAFVHSHVGVAHEPHSETEFGPGDDHLRAKYLDLFSGLTTPSVPSPSLPVAVVSLDAPAAAEGSVKVIAPRAHGPPAQSSLLLRAPPA